MLLTLPGTPFLYYGDELALENGAVPPERTRDVAEPSRDPARTPMPWTPEGGWVDPWLPLADTSRNVSDQRADGGSTLHFTRDLIALRRRVQDLRTGGYRELGAPPGAWAWRRGKNVTVALNLGSEPVELDDIAGTVGIATDRTRDGERVDGRLPLAPAQAAVVVA
jgi:alpha-glucosidase